VEEVYLYCNFEVFCEFTWCLDTNFFI